MAKKKGSNYEVGHGKPPEEFKFQKGKSGNPKGRPKSGKSKKEQSILAILKKYQNEKVLVTENGKTQKIPKIAVAAKQLINKAAAGDEKAIRELTRIALIEERNRPKLRWLEGVDEEQLKNHVRLIKMSDEELLEEERSLDLRLLPRESAASLIETIILYYNELIRREEIGTDNGKKREDLDYYLNGIKIIKPWEQEKPDKQEYDPDIGINPDNDHTNEYRPD